MDRACCSPAAAEVASPPRCADGAKGSDPFSLRPQFHMVVALPAGRLFDGLERAPCLDLLPMIELVPPEEEEAIVTHRPDQRPQRANAPELLND